MKWPRGRFNGRRIVGFEVRIRLDVCRWWLGSKGGPFGRRWSLGPVRMWFEAAYR